MGSLGKHLALAVIFVFLTSLVILQNGDVRAVNSDINSKLTIINPNNSTTYKGTVPLNFTIDWSVNGPIPWINMGISYSIDDSLSIFTNASFLDFYNSSTIVTTYTNTVTNISDLTDGKHKITIFAQGNYDMDNDFVFPYNSSFTPIYFSVNNSSNQSPPNEPFPSVTLAIVSIIAIVVGTSVGLLIYRKKHKQLKR